MISLFSLLTRILLNSELLGETSNFREKKLCFFQIKLIFYKSFFSPKRTKGIVFGVFFICIPKISNKNFPRCCEKTIIKYLFIVADPECLSWIPDPNGSLLRIQNVYPRSRIQQRLQKKRGKNVSFLNRYRKKLGPRN